ncbi:MAG: tyrosine-type recombinase/integrase [Chloroflexota bacterium]|nr:tyrosine-type recombinase/integrase [Chloroflexota bacterium]
MERSIQQYLNELQYKHNASVHTISAYGTDLDQFYRVLASHSGTPLAPEALTTSAVTHYVDWLGVQGYKPATVSRKLAAARSYLEFLSGQGLVDVRRFRELLKGPALGRPQPRTLSKQELDRLLLAPRKSLSPGAIRDAAILSLLYETGFRATDMVRLRVPDVDLTHAHIQRPPDRTQWVAIPESITLLQKYLSDGRPHFVRNIAENVLFLNQRGQGLSRQGLWLVVKRWAVVSELEGSLSPHTLRHSRASHMLEEGKSRREVQTLLGLSSPNAVRIHRRRSRSEDER